MTPYTRSAPQGLSCPTPGPWTLGHLPAPGRLDTTRPPDASRASPGPRTPPAQPPFTSPTPKVARNSATRKFNTAHKRCNTNGLVSKFERFTWNYVRHFSATTPNGARTRPHMPTRQHMPTQLRTSEPQGARHRAPASSRASARPTPRPRPHPPSPPHPKSRT